MRQGALFYGIALYRNTARGHLRSLQINASVQRDLSRRRRWRHYQMPNSPGEVINACGATSDLQGFKIGIGANSFETLADKRTAD
jgi:hypothetical protein